MAAYPKNEALTSVSITTHHSKPSLTDPTLAAPPTLVAEDVHIRFSPNHLLHTCCPYVASIRTRRKAKLLQYSFLSVR